MIHSLIAHALFAQLGAALPPDSVEAWRKRARSAESRFERMTRSLAPQTWSGGGGGACDEIVGRFCLRFDSVSKPPGAPERAEVGAARREAVETMRRYFGAAPGERNAAGPLVRLLVLDGRPAEALSAAEAFGILSRDTLWAALLTGYAAHATGRDDLAAINFDLALAQLPPAERRSWQDPEWLLDLRERAARRRMTESARADYDRRFWLHADPFWITPANEFRVEHFSRRVESRLLAQVPVVAGMLPWGRDLEELTLRYGIPKSRERISGGAGTSPEMVEHYDTTQRAYATSSLATRGIPEQPEPGVKPPLYAAAARAAYAYGGADRVLHVDHQATRFYAGLDVMLRVDGVVRRDSVAPSLGGVAGLVVYDSTLRQRRDTVAAFGWKADSARLSLLVAVPTGRLVYSVEALDGVSRAASQARYSMDALMPASGPVLSDILVSAPFSGVEMPVSHRDPKLQGLPSLIVTAGDTLGLFAELYRGGESLEITVSLEPATGPSLIGQAARWIGRATGIRGVESQPRVTWRVDGRPDASATVPISLNLPLAAQLDGLYRVRFRVSDSGGATTETARLIRVIGR